ncbi:MAG: GTP-binding protein, partial [Anaerolineae bacterium]|nr:GTP-binding protein [Anaerolineae bacterium]
MKEYTTDQLRNIVLAGHQGAGKTSVGESLLFATGAITRMGKVEERNTVADFDEDERARSLSIYSALLPIEYKGYKINVIDAPGYVDFQGEARNAIRVADAALIVVDAVSGPEVGTELSFDYAEEFDLPLMVLINKMDRENASFSNVLNVMRTRFPDYRFVPVLLPIGAQASFSGVVDLLTMKAYTGQGKDASAVPADLTDAAEEARLELMEAAAEADDALLEKYFESETLSEDEIRQGLLAAARDPNKKLIPVFASSATHSIGVLPLLDALVSYALPPSQRRVAVQAEREGEVEYLEPPQSDSGPVVAYVFHSHTDKYGTLTYFRLFSGVVKGNDTLINVDGGHEERLGALMTMRGDAQLPLDVVHAGDIAAVAKLRATHTGQTLASKGFNKYVTRPRFAEPVYAVAVHPRTQSDSAKMGEVLTDLTNADPTLRWRQDPALKQAILEGSGGTHIDIAVSRAERNGVSMDISIPKVPYLETITRQASAEYTHKKQTGGAGQFARVFMRVEPLPEGEGDFE